MQEPIRLPAVDSTMDEARRLARDGAPGGTVVVAERMTAGRGTRGRTWHAPEGGLYLSLILRDIDDPHLLTLALGNAVAETLEVAGAEPRLKWVNDVLIGDRKVAGILVEAESTGDRIDFLVAGIGVNVNGDTAAWPDDVAGIATTLEANLGAESCIPDLETMLLEAVERHVRLVRDGRNDEVLSAWRQRDALHGREVRVDAGETVAEGVAQGVDDNGHLIVQIGDGGIVVLDGGTVTLL